METMRRREAKNGGFGLASSDEEQRKACVGTIVISASEDQ